MLKIILQTASAQGPGDGQPARTGFYLNAISIINTFVTNNDMWQLTGAPRRGLNASSSSLDLFRRCEFLPVKFKRGVAMGQQIGHAVPARVEMEFVGNL